MFNDILTPMNHREIEYNAKKLSGCDIPDSFSCAALCGCEAGMQEDLFKMCSAHLAGQGGFDGDMSVLDWLAEMGKRVFDKELVMDYGTDCLRLYLLFESAPKENDAPFYDSWQEGALEGIYKFLGRYRRMVLTADMWNRKGNYTEETFSKESIFKLSRAVRDADDKIMKSIGRGNTMSNRHNIVSALMELLNVFQKELGIGKIVTALHAHAAASAVPHGGSAYECGSGQEYCDKRSQCVTKLYQGVVILTAPYAPDISKILWEKIK